MFTYCAIDGFHPVSENSENKLFVCKAWWVVGYFEENKLQREL